jgi:hypothetical protein
MARKDCEKGDFASKTHLRICLFDTFTERKFRNCFKRRFNAKLSQKAQERLKNEKILIK